MTRKWQDEKQFGRAVGIVFLVLGTLGVWRGTWPVAGPAMIAVGLLLAVLGVVAPGLLVRPRRYWMGLAEVLSFVSTRIILGAVFAGLVTPLGFIGRLRGRDPLGRRAASGSTRWQPYPVRQRSARHFEKMY